MIPVGIESLNLYCGSVYLDVAELADHRNLDTTRFQNLLMKQKSLPLPYEDPISYGVNAAKPIIDKLSPAEIDRIELLITCSESGIDFGKSMSTYLHDYLGLNRNCRMFELKQACYCGTAGLQMAMSFILSQASPGAKALVVATDIARFMAVEGGELTEDWSFGEPSTGAGAAALLVSETPYVFQADVGANGYYGYEVMDTCRPVPDMDAGDSDLSLLSYLDCCEKSFVEYQKRVTGVNYKDTFQYLSFHTPFGGMVKGAHRNMMRKQLKVKPPEIEEDFQKRVYPGIEYCQRVGNIMGATLFMSMASTIDKGWFGESGRIGCFSYGSGCCSEFYSGQVTSEGQKRQKEFQIEQQLDERYQLSMDEYHGVINASSAVKFGTRNFQPNRDLIPGALEVSKSRQRLVLKEIKEFHRVYEWLT